MASQRAQDGIEMRGRASRNRGLSLLEVAAAAVVVGVLAVAVVQLVAVTINQRRSVGQDHVALQECANVMERLFATTWDELTPEMARGLAVSAEAGKVIPGARLQIDIVQAEGQPDVKKITVAIRWAPGGERPERVARLVAWRYRR